MSEPREPLTPRERLSNPRREPKPEPKPRKTEPEKHKRTGFLWFLARFFVFGFYRLALTGGILVVLVLVGGFVWFSSDLPSVDSLKTYEPPLESRVYADNFQLVSRFGDENRVYVPYDQIPPLVSQAFISAEDRLFWVNPGINPLSIIRAGLVDVTRLGSGHRPLGASTITEQVVKNMLLDNHITFATKIKEAILAIRVSSAMTKPQVLTLYLNEIYLGNNSYGIAAAAQSYFDKPLSQLDIAQAATLAALPKAPSSYDPFKHPQDSLTRRNFIISRMQDDGAISAAQAQAAMAEPLLPRAGAAPLTLPNTGYFADAVHAALLQRFGNDALGTGGMIVYTSLNPTLQEAATDAVRDGLASYDHTHDGWHGLVGHISSDDLAQNWQALLAKRNKPGGMLSTWRLGIVLDSGARTARIGAVDPQTGIASQGTLDLNSIRWARRKINGDLGSRPSAVSDVLHVGDIVMVSGPSSALNLEQVPNIEGALICMDPRNGRVLAMVGGWSHDLSSYNRVIQASRQPGSSVKPLVYLTALESGMQPDAPVLDAPFVQAMPDGTVYRPGNYEDEFQGPVPMFHALEQSLNLATLHLTREIGLSKVANTFQSFGIIDKMPPYYPSAIGAIDTTLWKMAAAYAALDEGGRQITPTLIDAVTKPDGSILYQAPSESCDNCTVADPSQMPKLETAGAQLADPDGVFQIVTMMKGVVERGTGTPAVVGIPQPVAGKTGTTNNFADAWFLGFTPGVLTGCWVGFDTPANLGKDETGGNICGPIWNQFMKTALQGQPILDFAAPPGVTLMQTSFNGQTVTEAYKTGQTPGAQNNNSLLSGQMNSTDGTQPGTAGTGTSGIPSTTAPAGQAPDKALGGLY